MYRIATLPAVLSVVLAGLLGAQEVRPPQEGDRVRLSSPQHSGIATFLELTSDSLVILRPGDDVQLSIPVWSIRSFAVSRGRRSPEAAMRGGVFTGGSVGAVTGLVVGLLGGDDPPRCTQEQVWLLIGFTTFEVCHQSGQTAGQKGVKAGWQLGLAGAAVGALITRLRPGEAWEQTFLPFGTTVAPSGDGRMYAGFSFTF